MKQPLSYGFKVLIKHSRHYWSCTSPKQKKYIVGEYVEPDPYCGPLSVFSDIRSAHDFEQYLRNWALDKDLKWSTKACLYIKSPNQRQLWVADECGRLYNSLWACRCPKNTVLASKIMILKGERS